jgi:hypothetical protein
MIRIKDSRRKTTLKGAVLLSTFLLIAVATGLCQQVVNLAAGPATTTMPDGTVLPMWGYACGAAATSSTATCGPLTGSSSAAATGSLGGVYVINGGSGYTSAPTVAISAPTGTITGVTNVTATATAVVSNGQVVGVQLTNSGAGYVAAPTITLTGGSGTGAVVAAGPAWSPVVITVPQQSVSGGLTISLTNNLSFTTTGATNNIPTSIVIVGQIGGGLGGAPTTTTSPDHSNAQGCVSWFIAALPPGTPCTSNQSGASPPNQGPRVQSMATEVAAGAPGVATATSLTWANLKPGTYLLESGTHPSIQVPMGLIGMLVVTTAPSGATAGTAYPAGTATKIEAAIPAVTYSAEVPMEFSEIDPVQNKAVDVAVRTAGFSEMMVWSGLPTGPQGAPGCGNPQSSTYHQCYPPAVNYTPFYYLINGRAFDKTNPARSLFAATAGLSGTTPVTTGISSTGTVLVRMVNAGLKMHVPSIVGSTTTGYPGATSQGSTTGTVTGFTMIAEDGNPVQDYNPAGAIAPHVKTEVFMAAGKTYDVIVNVPTASLPIFDRELSLSANSSIRDAGMLAYISVNGSLLPNVGSGIFAAASANPDTYNSVIPCTTLTTCIPLVITDPSKGVIANDVNVYGVALSSPPANGTLSCGVVPGSPVAGICANGTFTYTPNVGAAGTDSFMYCANGAAAGTAGLCTTVTLGPSTLAQGKPTAINQAYTAATASFIKIPSPGLLLGNTDPNNLPITVVTAGASAPAAPAGYTLVTDPKGGFTLAATTPSSATTAVTQTFTYTVQNADGTPSAAAGTVTVTFPPPSKLTVNVLDAQAYSNCHGNTSCIAGLKPMSDYKWIIEEDKTFWIDPNCTTNASITTPGCATAVGPQGQSTIPTFGVNFHTSNMEFVAQGCTGALSCEGGQTYLDPATGTHVAAVCDVGNGACRPDTTGGKGFTPVNPNQVVLDPHKRYFISVLPGDAASPFNPAYLGNPTCNGLEATTPSATCGHTMSGASIPPACNILGGPNACTTASAFAPVNVLVLPTPLPTGKLSVIVFEDDYPLNGEQDGGGGNATVAPIEPGLGGFNLVLWDTYGGLGDATGQDTYDEFNQPLGNSLDGTVDPVTGLNACPISNQSTTDPTQAGITGMIVTCPKYESDGATLSPLAGQAVIANLMPEKFSVQAYPAADRIARGEQWVQTNTLDGQHPHDAFIPIGGPSYFQEYGPAGYHVSIGFANPAIINARHTTVCEGLGSPGAVGACTNTINGQVDVQRLSRTPDQRLYPSGSRDALAWTQCWVSLGDPDGEDFEFTFCDANGNFSFTNVPGGEWRITMGDQWNDQIVDGLSIPANVGCSTTAPNPVNPSCPGGQTLNLGNIGVQQWQSNIYTKTCIDDNKNGICDPGEIGIPFIYTMIHYRDGHNANALATDFNGVANFNETFPLFNWYVIEADSTRYKTTGVHTVYDAGGPADGSPSCGTTANGARACGSSTAYNYLTNTFEAVPLPSDLSVPGAVYCTKADCSTDGSAALFAAGTAVPSSSTASSGRIDPPVYWGGMEGWSGLTGQSNWVEFGKAPYAACPPACATVPAPGGAAGATVQVGENGGVYGQVAYASTRPFDDASQMIQQPWEPNVPNVTVNLYQEGFASDGVTPTLTMVDTTQTSSWDDWAQGFYPNSTAGTTGTSVGLKPYMSCPGQGTNVTGTPNQDLFYFTLFDQPNYLDWYNATFNGGTAHTLPYNSQYKCYDAMHIGNQLQPAPYDGKYYFPSSLGINPTTGKLVSTVGSTNGVAAKMAGTNCIVCVANPDSTDKYRVSTPMLPPGKYVVEVIMPPGYEVYKEEDKNLLIGDNFVAPAVQEFAGLGGDIFIVPDQASVASMYDESGAGYNGTNYQDSTTGLGLSQELSGVPGFPGYTDPVWPCVGEMRVVPDYLSIFPGAKETAPFAGATRPLCDRKEVTLTNQMAVNARFFIFTSTHIASKYTGVITDDYTSEFDPFAPQFGEKFGPPNLPVSTRDYLGNELSRVWADHWGAYDGLTYSSWEVNPPNITGYSPTMLTQCMNDPGPVVDTTVGSATYGQLINDPLYNPAYSNFCYINPFMPGLTTYNDTPVVPTTAFVGAGYNNVDCAYPDATPAIAEVDGDGIGPWVSASGKTLVITALGNQQVNNSAYSGPSANAAPFNMKTITRHYGFGASQGTGSVTIGGISATVTAWSDTSITVTVPALNTSTTSTPNGIQLCPVQQQVQYGGPGKVGYFYSVNGKKTATPANGLTFAYCGQLVVTAGNGKQSIDTVTVTVGGKAPTHVPASQTLQSAIDSAAPGDLLMVDPTCATAGTAVACSASALHAATQTAAVAAHNEMLLMWKPVRLQGVGAATSVIDANAFPAGRLLDPWRRHVNCLFGLSLTGVPLGSSTPVAGTNPTQYTTVTYDSTGTYNCPETTWKYFALDSNGQPNPTIPQIDRLPLEAVVGWDATVNGNLAEQLQEPSLMGAYEGAGITVLAKGVWTSLGEDPWTDGSEPGAFPPDALLLQDVPVGPDDEGAQLGPQYSYCEIPAATGSTTTELNPNPYPSNYVCNPASIDGLTVRNSSQGGGGIFVHGWAHNLQIANDRVYNNAGTLSGGVTVGQGEFPIALTVVDQEGTSGTSAPVGEFVADNPPSCLWNPVLGLHLPYCLDLYVNVHNNYITQNSSLGDELFSGTLAGGGGASFCTGSDYYKFQYNWVCGNLSSAEGGGVAHIGFIYDGDIEHNTITLNQSTNPTIPTNGGGLIVMGTPDTDPICGIQLDADCPPGLSDGIGPNLVINANLIQANTAESGAGGGLRMQQVNGTDISTFPNGCKNSFGNFSTCPKTNPTNQNYTYWNSVAVTNNIIVNNVAGWDGAGVSLEDSVNVSLINNTIASNDSLASSGVLTQSLGTPEASAPAGSCVLPSGNPAGTTQASCPQSAGLTAEANDTNFTTSLTGLIITCPPSNPNCTKFSNPNLTNNVIWQNRSFIVGIGNLGQGTLNQQKLVSLFDAVTGSPAPVQTAYGQCVAGVSYWDIGVRGDTGPTNHGSGYTLSPTYSVLDSTTGYAATNHNSNPTFTAQYCNGSRVPPNCTVADGCGGPSGYGVPPGIADATSPNPVFSLTPSATVDEGNNWVNVSWGPMALSDDSVTGGANGNYGGGNPFANYAPTSSSAVNIVPATNLPTGTYPTLKYDFFGTARPTTGTVTAGAIEIAGGGGGTTSFSVSPTTLAFGTEPAGGTSAAMTVMVTNTGTNALAGGTFTFGGGTPQPFARATAGGTCTATLAIGASCTYNVVFHPATGTTNNTAFSRTLAVAYTGATGTGTPVTLTGTSVTPGTLTFTSATNGALTTVIGVRTLTFTIPTPRAPVTSVVTMTNSGAGSLQITAETLTINIGTRYSITGTTCSFTTPLAAGGTCTVSIAYATPATQPALPDIGAMGVANNGTTGPTTTLALVAR